MDEPDEMGRLAHREAEYQIITRRANRRVMLRMALGAVVGLGVALLVVAVLDDRGGLPWPSMLLGEALGAGVAVAALFLWRRFAPDTAPPVAAQGLPRAKRWQVYRAMWKRRPLDDPALLPLVEEMERKMRGAFPIVVLSFGILGGLAVLAVTSGPAWFGMVLLVGLALSLVEYVFFVRRSALVARLTRESRSRDDG